MDAEEGGRRGRVDVEPHELALYADPRFVGANDGGLLQMGAKRLEKPGQVAPKLFGGAPNAPATDAGPEQVLCETADAG